MGDATAQPRAFRALSYGESRFDISTNGRKPHHGEIPFPPGLMGELASYIYETSVRPVREYAIASAIGLMAGICGRQFNISGKGLNFYLIVLGATGTGKEGTREGPDRIVHAARPQVPMIEQFRGPAHFASGEAMISALVDKPSMLAIIGEVGLLLKSITTSSMHAHQSLKRILLDLYGKSGKRDVLQPSAYSDKTKNTNVILSPALTVLGESTPETFYAALSTDMIAEGLVPRFLVIEYTGDRPRRNREAFAPPDDDLTQAFVELVNTCLTLKGSEQVVDITVASDGAAVLDAFEDECDDRWSTHSDSTIRELWNRTHHKAQRLAGLAAVGLNARQPVVDAECAHWAVAIARRDVMNMEAHFETGDIGDGDEKCLAYVRSVISEYRAAKFADLGKSYHDVVTEDMHVAGVIPHSWLSRKSLSRALFKNHPKGATDALRLTLKTLMSNGEIMEVPKAQMQNTFGRRSAVAYVVAE